MAELTATMPAVEASALFLAVDNLAKGRHAACGGKRSGVRIGRRRAEIHVLIDLPTLLRLNDDPADLVGHGPIPAQIARELAVDAAWRRLVTDPVTGCLLDYGTDTYRPPQTLVDFITARDRRCRFPGCENTASRCDLDDPLPQLDSVELRAKRRRVGIRHVRLVTRARAERHDVQLGLGVR